MLKSLQREPERGRAPWTTYPPGSAHVYATFSCICSALYFVVRGGGGLYGCTPSPCNITALSVFLRYSQGVGDVKANVSVPGVFSCHAFRRFWVSWGSGDVRVGKGHLMENTFLYWQDPTPFTVRAMALAAPTQATPVEWQFPRNAGRSPLGSDQG